MGYRRTARNCLWTSWTFVRKPWLEDCFLYILWQIQYLSNFLETIGWKWKISHAMPSQPTSQLLSNSSLLPQLWELTIIGRGWAKYRDLSKPKAWANKIIDLRDTGKSWYFAMIKFNIVLSFDHQVCFLMNIYEKWSDLPFFCNSSWRKGEKRAFI